MDVIHDDDLLQDVRSFIDSHSTDGQCFLLVNREQVLQRLKALRQALPEVTVCFDMARLDDPMIVKFVSSRGCQLAAWSDYHLRMARLLGIPSAEVLLSSPVQHLETLQTARHCQPRLLTIDSSEGVARLRRHGLLPTEDFQPTLAVLVRTGTQPHVNPLKIEPVLQHAKQAGFSRLAISAVVDSDHTDIMQYTSALQSCTQAMTVATLAGYQISEVRLCGGLSDPRTLLTQGVAPQLFFKLLSSAIRQFMKEAELQEQKVTLSVEAGRWLIGESTIAAQVTGTRFVEEQFQVFVEESRYGGLNRSMYDGEHIDALAVPRSHTQPPFQGALRATTIQLSSCDSVDALPGSFLLPEDLSAGDLDIPADWIAFPSTGSDSVSSAIDFNMIESPGVVLYSSSTKGDGPDVCELSPFLHKQQFVIDAARTWYSSSEFRNILPLLLMSLTPEDLLLQGGEALQARHVKIARAMIDNPNLTTRGNFLIQDAGQIVATIQALLRHLHVDALCIAQKAQNDPTVIALEATLNATPELLGDEFQGQPRVWMDTASAGEMEMARYAGFQPQHMIVSHPRKTARTLERMKAERPWAFTFDSEQELRRVLKAEAGPVKALSAEESYEPVALVRIKTSSQGVVNNLSAKFGCGESEAVRLLRLAQDCGFTRFGVAFHVGTQCCDAGNYARALRQALDVIVAARDVGVTVTVVDIGGGFPDARAAKAAGTTQLNVILRAGEAVRDFRQQLWEATGTEMFIVAEPGRVITDRGTIVTPVLKYSMTSPETVAHVRVGDHRRGGLSGAVHDEQSWDMQAVPRSDDQTVMGHVVTAARVIGSTGYGTDEFFHATGGYSLPSNVREGDHIAIFCTGSYSASAGAIAHGVEPPGVYMVFPGGVIRSPWFSKNTVFLEALERAARASQS